MKMTDLCDIALCSRLEVDNVSEVHIASIIRAMMGIRTFKTYFSILFKNP
jgi:hypothetical protein